MDLNASRFVARRYYHLQGLRLLPLAVPFMTSALWRSGLLAWLPISNTTIARRWFFSTFALSLILAWVLGLYYRQRFGSVAVARRFASVFWTIVFVATLVGSASLLPPTKGERGITMPMVVIAIGIAGVGVTGGVVRPAYLCVAGACALFSLLDILGVPAPTIPMLFDCLVATSLISIGIADHRLLTSTLQGESDACSL